MKLPPFPLHTHHLFLARYRARTSLPLSLSFIHTHHLFFKKKTHTPQKTIKKMKIVLLLLLIVVGIIVTIPEVDEMQRYGFRLLPSFICDVELIPPPTSLYWRKRGITNDERFIVITSENSIASRGLSLGDTIVYSSSGLKSPLPPELSALSPSFPIPDWE